MTAFSLSEQELSGYEHTPVSTLVSKNITVAGRRTSVRLEPEMWVGLNELAQRERCSIHDVCTLVGYRKNNNTSLTAAIRVFVMLYYRAASTEDGHKRVGHGNFEVMKRRARIPDDMMQYFSPAHSRSRRQIDRQRVENQERYN